MNSQNDKYFHANYTENYFKPPINEYDASNKIEIKQSKFKKFFSMGSFSSSISSIIITILGYSAVFGFKFALGIVLLIFVHEMGHVLAGRLIGIKLEAPTFIPFAGAIIRMNPKDESLRASTIIGIGGPILGTIGAIACHLMYLYTNNSILLELTYIGYLINLFNLSPVYPLDGGRTVLGFSPLVWLPVIPILSYFTYISNNGILFIITIFAILYLYKYFKKPFSYKYSNFSLVFIILYFGLVAYLSYVVYKLEFILNVF